MTEQEKKERIAYLWSKARRYTNKLRFQVNLQKKAEMGLREMTVNDVDEIADDESDIVIQPKLKWYLIDTEKTFCKLWDFAVTIVTIYNLFVIPVFLVFPDVYQNKDILGFY